MRAILLLVLASCGIQEIGGGLGLDLPGLDVVYECDRCGDDSEGELLELCFDGSADELGALVGGTCEPTSRHLGPCIYRCPSQTGANAKNGSWCP